MGISKWVPPAKSGRVPEVPTDYEAAVAGEANVEVRVSPLQQIPLAVRRMGILKSISRTLSHSTPDCSITTVDMEGFSCLQVSPPDQLKK